MQKIITYATFLFAAGIMLYGCEEKVVNKFDENSSLYFYRDKYTANAKGLIQYDSIDYSFFLAGSAQEAEIWLQVNLTGNMAGVPRPFSIVQTNTEEPGAALAGIHYVAFDDPRMAEYLQFPPQATTTLLPVILTRHSSMSDRTFRLVLSIQPNGNFAEGIKQGEEGQQTFVINITAEAIKPVTWDRNYDYAFGNWGKEKMRFLIDHVGFSDFETDMSNLDTRYYWNLKAKTALAQYETEQGAVYEEDGITKVTFP